MTQEPRTRAQRQAEAALAVIQSRRSAPEKERKEYKARADSFPVLVLQSGLAQAVGFMLAKAAKSVAYERYLNDLATMLGFADGAALQQRAISAELRDYRQLTREALAAASWLKRFGQAYLAEKGD